MNYIRVLLIIDCLNDFIIHSSSLAFAVLELIYLLLQLIHFLFMQCYFLEVFTLFFP